MAHKKYHNSILSGENTLTPQWAMSCCPKICLQINGFAVVKSIATGIIGMTTNFYQTLLKFVLSSTRKQFKATLKLKTNDIR